MIARGAMARESEKALAALQIKLPSVRVPVAALSGGQKQAVAVARASMWSTTGILMDEPTAALGTRQSDVVCELIRRTADSGLGVMVISHDLPRILAIADRIIVLRHGMVALTGSPTEITRRDVVDAMVGYHERAGTPGMSSQTALPDPADVMDPADETTRTPTIWNSLLSDTAVWILAIDVILVIIFGFWSPQHTFWSVASLQVIALDASTALILCVGISLLLGAGEIDLSVGAGLLLASVYGGKVILDLSSDGVLFAALAGLVVCIAVGAAVGLFNGLIVTKLRVNSLIATLGTLGICTGIANLATNGADLSGLPFQMQDSFGIKSVLNIPLPAFVALGVWAVSWFIFRTTRYGLRMLSLGSSRSAAERSGIRVDVHLIVAFVLVGSLAGLAGFIELTRFATTNLAGHQTDALAAITAAVIGGTSLFGGRVSIGGVLTGTLLAVILQDGLVVVGLSPFYQLIAVGVVLIAAVYLDTRRTTGTLRFRR